MAVPNRGMVSMGEVWEVQLFAQPRIRYEQPKDRLAVRPSIVRGKGSVLFWPG